MRSAFAALGEQNAPLTGKNMVVIGRSRGVGQRMVEYGIRNDAHVLSVARQEGPLRRLAHQSEILVLCAGVFPPAAPLHELSWQVFAVNWEADVKIAFPFCKPALSRPLPAGGSII
jgi:NAD(P)-dependent dehydrogenase (short-subunit alcohol dehydrogenase family)